MSKGTLMLNGVDYSNGGGEDARINDTDVENIKENFHLKTVPGAPSVDLITEPVVMENEWGWAEIELSITVEEYQSLITKNSHMEININGIDYVLPRYDFDSYGDWEYEKYPCAIEIYVPYGINSVELGIDSIFEETELIVSYIRIVYDEYVKASDIADQTVAGLIGASNGGFCTGIDTMATGKGSMASGLNAEALSEGSVAMGIGTKALSEGSVAMGVYTKALYLYSHAEGYRTLAEGEGAHAEGAFSKAFNRASHVESYSTMACGADSHAEGWNVSAFGNQAHAECNRTIALGACSHAEGGFYIAQYSTTITAINENVITLQSNTFFDNIIDNESTISLNGKMFLITAHNKNDKTVTVYMDPAFFNKLTYEEIFIKLDIVPRSMVYVYNKTTIAKGRCSHAEGLACGAFSEASHAEGYGTSAKGDAQHAQGKWNITDTTSLHIVGNGTDINHKSNAHTIDQQGNAWFSGDVYIGSTSGTNKDEGSKKLYTRDDVIALLKELHVID